MRVQVRTMSQAWQGANLCLLPPGVMNELQVTPGALILLENPTNDKRSLSRLFVPLKTVSLMDYYPGGRQSDFPEVAIDAFLLKYLDLEEGGQAELVVPDPGEIHSLTTVTFIIGRSLAPEEQGEALRFIKEAGWPVFPGGQFAVNLSGSRLDLGIPDRGMRPGVIEGETLVTLVSAKDDEMLTIEREIFAHEAALEHLDRQERIIHQELEELAKGQKELSKEEDYLNEIMGRLEEERDKIQELISRFPGEEERLREQLTHLQGEGARLAAQREKMENFTPPRLDLEAKRAERDKNRQDWGTLFDILERKVCGFDEIKTKDV